ncbi:MAG: cytochrome c oxidase subunit 3 [Alphaproteobacteria bacterium]|nr:cytochrome c oxidase subunit 3 [Alphaproteobacteria bacterium]
MSSDVKHDYHLVDPSPWPVIGSVFAFTMMVGAVFWMNKDYAAFGILAGSPWIALIGFTGVLYTMAGWWRDVIKESVVLGNHTPVVKLHLRYGMLLFIASEVMFFVAWFWAFFNASIFHADVGVATWPPAGIITLDPWHFPLLNTLILLTSGTTVTWAHHAIQTGDRKGAIQGLLITVLLGLSFTAVQAYEYAHAPFTFGFNNLALVPFAEGSAHALLAAGAGNFQAIYGSTFFMATGFHGFHVIVGTIFLAVCLFRAIAGQFTPTRHFGFEAAAWYWHFVDVVWLFLFACIYVWGEGPLVQG